MKVRKISLSSQIFFVFLIVFVISDIVIGVMMYNQTKTMMLEDIRSNAKSTVNCVAQSVDAKAFSKIQSMGDDAFNTVYDDLNLYKQNADVEYVYTLKETDGGPVFVVDTDPEEPGQLNEEYEYTDAMKEAFAGKVSVDKEPYTDEWGSHISAYGPIVSDGQVVGIAVIDLSATDIAVQTKSVAMKVILICGISLAALIATLFVIIMKLKKGFQKLDDKICDLTDGSGDLSKEIIVTSGDEFEVIATDINHFIKEIRGLVANVAGASTTLIDASTEIKSTVSDNNNIISTINDEVMTINANMEECSATSESACSNLSESARELTELTNQIEKVEEYVSKIRESATDAKQQAQTHKESAIEQMNILQAEVAKASEEAKSIEEILTIATQITEIAEQTNLLSLNAQIEAARAGEAGRGFAIVATSVAELSNEITKSVAEINDINYKVMNSVEQLNVHVQEMSEFMSKDVVRDYEAFANLGQEYGDTSERLEEMMSELYQTSGLVNTSVNEANESIKEISASVAESANGTEQLVAAVSNISESMSGLEKISIDNEECSSSMSQQISKYKV